MLKSPRQKVITDRFLDMDPIVRKHETKIELELCMKHTSRFYDFGESGKKISDPRLPVD